MPPGVREIEHNGNRTIDRSRDEVGMWTKHSADCLNSIHQLSQLGSHPRGHILPPQFVEVTVLRERAGTIVRALRTLRYRTQEDRKGEYRKDDFVAYTDSLAADPSDIEGSDPIP